MNKHFCEYDHNLDEPCGRPASIRVLGMWSRSAGPLAGKEKSNCEPMREEKLSSETVFTAARGIVATIMRKPAGDFDADGDPDGPARWKVHCGRPVAEELKRRPFCEKHLGERP